jgi:hypothetical protein
MKLSLIVPSINSDKWININEYMKVACKKYLYEIIGVGPKFPDQSLESIKNFKFLRDFGCPSRAFQLATMIAEGEYIAWCSDDSKIIENSIDECIAFFDNNMTENDAMTLRYSEGENYTGNQHNEELYWIGFTHTDLKQPGVHRDWKIAPLFMIRKSLYYKHGGLDCRFEHINMNTHDLMFAIQKNGGKLYCSPSKVFSVNWSPNNNTSNYQPIFLAYHQNDLPLFKYLYQQEYNRSVDFENWRLQPSLWSRRYKE